MPLEPGSRIGRIRVDALLGAGGMGEVYRGWDEKLERAVALKAVHPDKRVHAAVRAWFLREARVLSQLDHPNICRIYDVLERDEGDYLVLELVEGQTLRERMATLSRAEAVEIALQVARVLAVTHARGIVHRDLKPDNIMIMPSGQVKVLDFGLARFAVEGAPPPPSTDDETPHHVHDDENTVVLARPQETTEGSHTVAGSLVGTLHYMSPEQARGLPITEASDVYSLAVLIYEMLAGRSAYGPVESATDLLILVRRAQIVPHDFDDDDLDALLRRMLVQQPADRANAATVVRELEAIRERPERVRRHGLAAAAIVIVAALIAGAVFVSRRAPAKLPRGRIAVLPFRNATGDRSLAWIERGLADLVLEGTQRARGAEVLPVETVVRAMRNLRIDAQRELPDAQRRSLLTSLGADVLIAPVVTLDDGGKYTIRYAALMTDRAEPPREAASTVLTEAARQMSVDLAQRIDPASVPAVRARTSLDNVTNMLYAMGMQELRTRGPRIAAHYFTLCVDRDPEFLAAKNQLANAEKAMAANERASQLLGELLTQARARNDRDMVARGLLTRARWGIDDGDYAAAKIAGREALAIALALGDRNLVGEAHRAIGSIAWRQGLLDEARAEFEESLRIFTELHDALEQAQAYNNLGVLGDSIPDRALAKSSYAKALAIGERTNDRYLTATVVGNLAGVYAAEGDLPRAETWTRRQVALTREIGDTASEVYGLVNLGLYLWAQGKETEAVTVTRDAATVAAKTANPRVEAVILANLAVAETKLGDLAAAREHNAAAARIIATLKDPEVERDVHLAAAYTSIREGHLDEAARSLDRAEAWRSSARCVIMRARLAYARADYQRAFDLIRKAKTMDDVWLIQNEQMYRAFEESARTGRAATLQFEGER